VTKPPDDQFVVNFPTLWVAADWIERHCVIPDGENSGEPLQLQDWQLWSFMNHYRVRPDATPDQRGTAFTNRRSQVIGPQKAGKSPFQAAHVCVEAVGPVLFAGWATTGRETYKCSDHGCPCGWVYRYEKGDPMGRLWPTPLIQITATSEDQAGNIYDALRPMIVNGPLSDVITKVGEEFIRLPNGGRIDVVTSSATSRLGQRVTFVPQDETGIWTAQNGMIKVATTQRRGLAGMAGRSVEITNPWDPAEQSVAQQSWESQRPDIFKFWRQPPAALSYRNKKDRAQIHAYVYRGSPWVDLDAIEAEAAELLEKDPAQAERFFGNRVVAGAGSFLPAALWEKTETDHVVPAGAQIAIGFDGSDSDDWTAIRAVELETLHRFTPTYGPDSRPTYWNPAEWEGSIPRDEVNAAIDELCSRYNVTRAYCDPPDWRTEIGDWSLKYGDKVFIEWPTYRLVAMHAALERNVTDLASGRSSHDNDPVAALHYSNSRKLARSAQRYVIGKASQKQKIDIAMADSLGYEAACDAIAAGALNVKKKKSRVVGW
jgi:hypothetical protein